VDLLTQTALILAITSFALGFSTLGRNVRNKLYLAYAGLCSTISLWAGLYFTNAFWPGWGLDRLHLLTNVWLGPVALVFVRVLVRLDESFSRRLRELAVVLSIALTIALFFELDRHEEWVRQLVLFAPAAIVVQILRLLWIDWRIGHGLRRLPKLPTVGLSKRPLIYGGALLVMLTVSLDHLPWTGRLVPSIGNLLLTFYLFFVSQAITQQRLLNFPALLSRFIVLGLIALGLSAIYSLLIVWVPTSFVVFFLNSFMVSFALVVLLEPLQSLVRWVTGRMVTKEHRQVQQILREAQRRLTGITEPAALLREILTTVEQMLRPQRAAVYVLRGDGTRYRRALDAGAPRGASEPAPVREVLSGHPLLAFCETLRDRGLTPVVLDQVLESEIERSASRVQREHLTSLVQALRALRCNLMIPLVDAGRDPGRILGFVAVESPTPPQAAGNWSILAVILPYFEQAARALRDMEVFARAREKDRLAALGEMAAGLAHEIRNPLGAIKGAAQFLDSSEDAVAPARPESPFLKVIIEEVDRLNRVVTQFLDYSKPAAPELRSADLAPLVSRSVERMRPALPPGLRLEFTAPREPLPALVSPEQLHQVLLNLVQNSQRALEGRADGRIRVSLEREPGTPPEAQILVEDDGPGIPRENLEKLFIPFFTTRAHGTGLGLSICQKIIEAHRGRIEVSSEEGRFARFSVILPLHEA
jgi:signal transduction histidine kinase